MMPESSNKPFSGIFISYRRNDCPAHAGRLKDNLVQHFGTDQIFMDVDNIGPGEDFVDVIENALSSCAILIAMIGRDWLRGADEKSRPFDDEHDYVRLEIATALRRNVKVFPVLVEGAKMPAITDLPEDMAKLKRRNAVELSDLRWARDVAELISHLEKIVAGRKAHDSEAKPMDAAVGAAQAAHEPIQPVPRAREDPMPGPGDGAPRTQPGTIWKIVFGLVIAAVLITSLVIWNRQRSNDGPLGNTNTAPSPTPSVKPELSAEDNSARGREMLEQKRYEEAEGYFREAVNQVPSNAEYNNQLGVALLFQKKYIEAEPYLREAVARSPGNPQYNTDVGNVLNHLSKYAEAETFDFAATRLDPNNANHHNNLGLDLYYQGKKARAEKSFAEAVRLDPNNARFNNDLGNALFDQGKFAKAKSAFQKASDLDQSNDIYRANVRKAIQAIESGR